MLLPKYLNWSTYFRGLFGGVRNKSLLFENRFPKEGMTLTLELHPKRNFKSRDKTSDQSGYGHFIQASLGKARIYFPFTISNRLISSRKYAITAVVEGNTWYYVVT